MKTNVIVEEAIFTLNYSDYDTSSIRELFVSDLKNADIGHVFQTDTISNCGRGVNDASLEVIYKTNKGVACLYRNWGSTDEPNPEEWEAEPNLIWFELH